MVAAGLVYVFLHAPLVALMVFSFNDSKFAATWTGFTLEWYRRLFEREDILEGLRRSLVVGLVATAVATVFGTLIALALSRHRFRGRRAVESVLYLPLVTPEIIMGISLLILFGLVGFPWYWVGHGGAHRVLYFLRDGGRRGPASGYGPPPRGGGHDVGRR